jgi:RNA polymerase-binding transcription factor DksA
MENRICIKCNETINPLRIKALPQTLTCVDCSTIGAKKGVSMMFGEKDHTWTDMVIVDPDKFEIAKSQKAYLENIEEEIQDEDENVDEEDDLEDWDDTLLDGLEDL